MTYEEAKERFELLFENKMSEDEAREFLISLYKKQEEPQEIAAAAEVMREHSIKLDLPKDLQDKLVDVVGTGGDQSGTFNISSTVALLLASLGVYVAKHGNRAITSKSGSADMLEALGINLDLSLDAQKKMLEETNFCFMFAKNHHPAMKFIMPIRKSIPHRTIFNILGPLTNPAGAKRFLLGVFDKKFVPLMADALKMLGAKDAYVVSGLDGMDEISICDKTFAMDLDKNEFLISPEEFGFAKAKKEDILGKDAKENAKITFDIFDGKEKGAKKDAILLNAAFALKVANKVENIKDGVEMAKEVIDKKQAKRHLQKIIEISNKLK